VGGENSFPLTIFRGCPCSSLPYFIRGVSVARVSSRATATAFILLTFNEHDRRQRRVRQDRRRSAQAAAMRDKLHHQLWHSRIAVYWPSVSAARDARLSQYRNQRRTKLIGFYYFQCMFVIFYLFDSYLWVIFPSIGYSKQFLHILFSTPTQNLLLQSSFSASLVPHSTPARRLRFGRSIADIVRFTNSFTYLFTFLFLSCALWYLCSKTKMNEWMNERTNELCHDTRIPCVLLL